MVFAPPPCIEFDVDSQKMKFIATTVSGAFVVELDLVGDERGFFARTFSREEFTRRGLDAEFAECSISLNRRRGTLRGMHYQDKPHEETKLVRCTSGSIFDVVLDLRSHSSSYRQWSATEL